MKKFLNITLLIIGAALTIYGWFAQNIYLDYGKYGRFYAFNFWVGLAVGFIGLAMVMKSIKNLAGIKHW